MGPIFISPPLLLRRFCFWSNKSKISQTNRRKERNKKWKLLIFFSFKTYQKSHKENSINIEEKSEYPKKVKVWLSALQSGNLQNLSTQFFIVVNFQCLNEVKMYVYIFPSLTFYYLYTASQSMMVIWDLGFFFVLEFFFAGGDSSFGLKAKGQNLTMANTNSLEEGSNLNHSNGGCTGLWVCIDIYIRWNSVEFFE